MLSCVTRHVFIVTFLFVSLCSFGQSALTELVDEEFENEKLAFILKNLDRKYQIDIRFNATILPISNNSYDFNNLAMRDVLNVLLKDNNLDYVEYAQDRIIVVPSTIVNDESSNDTVLLRSTPVKFNQEDVTMTIGIASEDIGPFSIAGVLLDTEEEMAIDNALILDKTSGEFTYSNKDGQFELVLTKGIHEINISSITHQNYNKVVAVVGPGTWEVKIPYKSYYIEEVTVSAISDNYKIKENISGLEQISTTEIKQLNSFMGENDVIKSLTTVAGVSNIGEGASGFNVRGGNIDQNLILQDGAIILNPSHILGFFSIFNADVISTTSLYKGHMPAQYGGRSSSVLDISLREGDFETFKIGGSLGLISSKVASDIPVVKGKSALVLSARASYINWWLRGVSDIDIQRSDAQFFDVNAKYTHKISDRTKLIGSYFRSFDELQFANDFGYSWKNEVGNFQLKHILNDNTSIGAKYVIGTLSNAQFVPSGPLAFDLSSGMKYTQLGINMLYSNESHEIRAGAEYINQNTKPEVLIPINNSASVSDEIEKEKGSEISIYVNDQFTLNDRIGLDLGLRLSLYQQSSPGIINTYTNDDFFSVETIESSRTVPEGASLVTYTNLEPRISLRYNLTNQSSIKLSYNRTVQNVHLLSNTTTPTPIDVWQVSNTHIRPLVADNYSIGVHHKPTDDLTVTAEGFYKKLNNTIDYRDFADITLNPHLETAILLGEGRAFGGELSINKSGKKISARINYSYSRSMRRTNRTTIETINNGAWFSSNFDTPHEVKFFLNWQISKRDRFNVNFNLKTGRPITAPISNFILQDVVIPDFSERNAIRLPDYHRLDISYTFRINRRTHTRYKSEFTFSFYNVYSRRNPFSVFFRQGLGSSINALQLSVIGTMIPSVTYNFSF